MTAPASPDQDGILIRGLSFAVAGKTILSGLDAHLTEARIGIVGRNGSGKTTLLRLIAGLISPTKGQMRIFGIDPARDRKAAIGTVGLLFQNPDHQIIFPTVEEELAFGLRQQGRTDAEARGLARAVLARHGRSHWAGASVQTLSQGQRHYLCLLSVLAMGPAVILLDEPFSGLDLPTQAQLTRALDALPQQLVTITHDPALVEGYDRVLWLDNGRLRADGPAGPVLAAFGAEMQRLGDRDADADLPD
ncbi:MAG: ABC transporter ATP-binding protein [Rhodobacteraceae bacterium]|jgi:biotin transport system ATP-binding protein|nr:ABC transporter ATP-binding protein [Paracoccaceae bacterium]